MMGFILSGFILPETLNLNPVLCDTQEAATLNPELGVTGLGLHTSASRNLGYLGIFGRKQVSLGLCYSILILDRDDKRDDCQVSYCDPLIITLWVAWVSRLTFSGGTSSRNPTVLIRNAVGDQLSNSISARLQASKRLSQQVGAHPYVSRQSVVKRPSELEWG